ncbi:hypothetical protein IU449_27220 [Nocardia higoensis]|uniref:Phage minor capsid protein 2 n=1 Tax=Nocardia higoensis TaxID=228599 RepID=A0ABS0DIA2_9NOCA|nr:phage minor capsid protein [Nocardia higoensis]MBF6358192.1 hypothetical protein [Nocardia higoensis]
MPLTPSFGDRRVGPIVRLYRRLEKRLLELLATGLPASVRRPYVWLQQALLRTVKFRLKVRRTLDDTEHEFRPLLAEALTGAWRDGMTAARLDLPHTPPVAVAVQSLIDDTLTVVRAAHDHVPQVMEDGFRRIVNDAVRADPADSMDRDRIVRRALEVFARKGITGFVDARGRRYDLVSYVELAVRSAITRAEVDGYCAQAAAAGHDLFIVSDVPGACPLCRQFEGECISISGATVGAISVNNSLGSPVAVRVLCSLAEARERGLFHRGCRHTIRVWTPDAPTPPRAVRVPDEVRARRRQARALARRQRQQERVNLIRNL